MKRDMGINRKHFHFEGLEFNAHFYEVIIFDDCKNYSDFLWEIYSEVG